ncbi:MAG TPA: hypothetical protein VFI57_09265 [Pyrinomonadaceae bacterium]|nr:hypothetical protein [Pyrinomonadaceae bacterium]
MKDTKCEAVRSELEELMLGDECSVTATQHLRECGNCREFHQKQTKLRQLVGSLGTVEAPADFDFRLRARLANESNSAGFHLRMMQWSFASKGFAAATMMLLFVGGVVYVGTLVNPSEKTEVSEQKNAPDQTATLPAPPAPKPAEDTVSAQDQTPAVASADGPRRNKGERRSASRPRVPLVAIDSAIEAPIVISNSQRQSAIFPINASYQPLKLSLDDGRGNARTISLPTITFGSQRVLPGSNQFVQKGAVDW